MGQTTDREVTERFRKIQGQKRMNQIKTSRYNITILRKEVEEVRVKMITRFRYEKKSGIIFGDPWKREGVRNVKEVGGKCGAF